MEQSPSAADPELSVAGHTGTDRVTAGDAKVYLAGIVDAHKLVSSCLGLSIYSLLPIFGSYELSVAGHTGTDGVTAGNAKVSLAADADVSARSGSVQPHVVNHLQTEADSTDGPLVVGTYKTACMDYWHIAHLGTCLVFQMLLLVAMVYIKSVQKPLFRQIKDSLHGFWLAAE